MIGLDAPDAVHASIASAEKCNIFVTRDRDFIKRKKTLEPYFEVLEPQDAVRRLEVAKTVQVKLADTGP